MAERELKMNLFGREQTVTDVPIVKADEKSAEYELEDGSILRVRYVPNAILRLPQREGDGTPVYLIKNGTVTTVLKIGERVKVAKPATGE